MLLAAALEREPPQQRKVVYRGHEIRFALTVPAQLKRVRNFFKRADAAFGENLQQQFETCRLKLDALDALAPHYEKS